jgi:chromosome segregation ATPase
MDGGWREQVAEIASAVSQTQGRVDDISQKQEKTNQELEENKKKMRELEEMVRKLSADGGDKDKLKDKYQKKIKELEEEISALKQTNRDSDRAHALELESLKNKIESLKDKRDAAAEVTPDTTHTHTHTHTRATQHATILICCANRRRKGRSGMRRTRPGPRSRP